MDGVSHQLIDRGGDSMRFGDTELERHEGHREDVRWPAEDVIRGGAGREHTTHPHAF